MSVLSGPKAPHELGGSLSAADIALRRDRAIVVTSVALVTAASWAWLLSGAGTMQEMGGMLMPMSSGLWTASHAATMLLMWTAMMVAMMLPSAVPMVLFYAMIARKRTQAHPRWSVALFIAGYMGIWLAFSLAATGLQFVLERAALLSSMMETTSIALAGFVFVAAGLYQWMPIKQSCLRRCRSPLDFVLAHWRNGRIGAFAMGFRHGADCLGCCWMLMLLLFVGGIMNLAWIAGLALFVLVEKFVPAGHWISRAAGVLLVAWGIVTWLAPAVFR